MPDLTGKTFGKYRIVEHIGGGGMADVYKAYQANLDRHVALKLMRPFLAEHPDNLARFDREAKNVAALRHSNIVQVHDFDVEGDTPYIVMEFIEGISLKEHLEQLRKRGEWVTDAEAVRIIHEIGQALRYAHQHGIIHRDVKPANVMMDVSERIILTDFGIAKILTGPSYTAAGTAIGTPAYMAPEQGQGLPGDARADIYSLSVMLYELLTGRLPYEADTPMAVILKHISEPLPPPRDVNPNLSKGLERVILTGLAKDPDERFQSVDEMLVALHEALVESQTQPAVEPQFHELPTRKAGVELELSTIDAERPVEQLVPTPRQKARAAPERDITPPPQPALPPRIGDFVGREDELAQLEARLTDSHLVIITGMPGIGKTTLAAMLAERLGQLSKTFWHSFHENEGVDVLLWKLAGFLFWHNAPELWGILQRAQQTGSQPPPAEVLFDYLFQAMQGQDFLLCLDDFQYVEDDALLSQFVEGLQEVIQAREVSILLTSRRKPEFMLADGFEPLTGLSAAAVRELLDKRGLNLSDQLITTLCTVTEGNAQLLTLALDALRRGKDPGRLLQRLSESEHIERFLVKEVDEGLTDEEREVMCAVAVLMGYPGTRDAISTVLDGRSVRRALNDLSNRYLLTVIDRDIGKEYALHAMMRAFYYDLLDKRERRAMHLRAGEYYEKEEPDVLKAAYHFQRGGQEARAARLVTADVWGIINRGQARALRLLLAEGLSEGVMEPAQWAEVNLARGQVYTLLGETSLARASYEAAHTRLAALPDSPAVRELRARACRGVAESLQDDAPHEALNWLSRGLQELGGASASEEAALHIRSGRVLVYQGKNNEAEAELQRGLALLPEGPSRLRITALGNLGNIYCTRGDRDHGLSYYHQVSEIARQLNDYWLMAENWINIGIELDIAGRWAEAVTHYRQALEQSERLGSVNQQARAVLGIGNTCAKMGDDEAALENLSKSLAVARREGWQSEQVYAAISLAGVHVSRAEAAEANALLAEAEHLAQETGVREPLPELYYTWALVRLRQDNPQSALTYADQALSLARAIQSETYEGVSLRVLGQAQWECDQREAALASFDNSLQILANRDPYEAARTKMEWGLRLESTGNVERGATLLREAGEAFRQLGARRELAEVDNMLK